jgi:hypothetical protein
MDQVKVAKRTAKTHVCLRCKVQCKDNDTLKKHLAKKKDCAPAASETFILSLPSRLDLLRALTKSKAKDYEAGVWPCTTCNAFRTNSRYELAKHQKGCPQSQAQAQARRDPVVLPVDPVDPVDLKEEAGSASTSTSAFLSKSTSATASASSSESGGAGCMSRTSSPLISDTCRITYFTQEDLRHLDEPEYEEDMIRKFITKDLAGLAGVLFGDPAHPENRTVRYRGGAIQVHDIAAKTWIQSTPHEVAQECYRVLHKYMVRNHERADRVEARAQEMGVEFEELTDWLEDVYNNERGAEVVIREMG